MTDNKLCQVCSLAK